jgi:flavin-dependent dehydrogenase
VRRTGPLIVGGGPAGSAAAIRLAADGLRPLLIERSTGPHDTVCGAFVGWDALARLTRLGIDAAVLGARPIHRVRLIAGNRVAEARLPHAAAGLSRAVLDQALLDHAAGLGADVVRGTAVRRANGTSIVLGDGSDLIGSALFLATGKHELRGLARDHRGRATSIGLRRRLEPSRALFSGLDGVVELHLLDGGYAGLLLQEDGAANLCLSITPARLSEAGGIDALMLLLGREAPRLGERLATMGGAWSTIAQVPYGWRASAGKPGLFRLGDQAAVIASLAGDGVAIALASGESAALAYAGGGVAAARRWQRWFARQARRPVAIAQMLRAAGERPRLAPPLVALLARMPEATSLLGTMTRIG